MQVCGCLGLRCAVRRRKGFGHMSLGLSRLCTYQRFCCFHILCRLAGYWFMVSFTPYTITHMGGLCFVEFGSMDHGGSWKCFRVLKIGFVSSISFLGVRLVSGVFGCLTEIYIS